MWQVIDTHLALDGGYCSLSVFIFSLGSIETMGQWLARLPNRGSIVCVQSQLIFKVLSISLSEFVASLLLPIGLPAEWLLHLPSLLSQWTVNTTSFSIEWAALFGHEQRKTPLHPADLNLTHLWHCFKVILPTAAASNQFSPMPRVPTIGRLVALAESPVRSQAT